VVFQYLHLIPQYRLQTAAKHFIPRIIEIIAIWPYSDVCIGLGATTDLVTHQFWPYYVDGGGSGYTDQPSILYVFKSATAEL
jgi:hypothetical protein